MSGEEELARQFHETYERLAPAHAYETRKASAVPWEAVPENNKALMIAVCAVLLAPGGAVDRIAAARSQQRAAEELEAAADDMPGRPGTNPAQDWLLARADALRAGSGTP